MNIKIGQYIAGDSFLHKLDPRIKMICMFILIILIFLVPVSLEPLYMIWMASLFLFTIGLIFLSGIPFGKVMQGLKAIVFLLTFTVVIQLFSVRTGINLVDYYLQIPYIGMTISIVSVLALIALFILYQLIKPRIKFKTTFFFIAIIMAFVIQWATFEYIPAIGFEWNYEFVVYSDGLVRSLFIFMRIFSVMIVASLLTFTTTTIELNDALEGLMMPLRWIGVPTYIFSMMISLTLRSIPTLLDETEKIMKAQTSRGADFNESTIKEKIGQIIALLIPVFVISFNRADDLSNAMEARGYIIGEKRTRLDVYQITLKDISALIFVSLVLIGYIVTYYAL